MSAVIQNEYTQNDTTTVTRQFTFPYLKTSDIKVSLDGVETTAFTLANATTIQFNSVPPQNTKIKIFRETSVDSLTATFYAGSAIKSEDLNDNFTQNLYKTQEVGERALNTLGGTMTGNLTLDTQADLVFEGATADAHETTIKVVDPTADRTITFPNVTGTVVTTGDTGTVATGMIAGDAVNGDKIADNAINSEHYTDGSIDRVHLAADIVDGTKIADDSVDSEHLVSDSIDTEHYAAGSIDATALGSNAVTRVKIIADAVDGTKIADDSINSEHYVDGSIDNAHLANNSVSLAKMADDSVGTAELVDSSVVTAALADNAVTLAKMADNSVGTSELVDSSVTTAKITDANVTTAKIADNAVTMAKLNSGTLPTDITVASANLVDGTIVAADLASNAVTTVKITDANVTTDKIADSNVTTVKIAADAITGAKIADDQINSEHYVAGSIDTEHIADAQITTAKIADSNVTTAKIANDAITTGKIAAGAVDSSDIGNGVIDTVHIGSSQVTTAKIADSNITTAKISDANVTTAKIADSNVTLAKLASDLKQTSISDSDTQIPTSGAVVDYVAAQLAPLGGFEAIANEQSFPNTQPASGVVISIADAGGLSVSNSGTASGQTVGGTTVNITGIASNFNGTTVAAGIRFLVASTGSGQNYTYHKATLKEDDLLNLSGDINDFAERYRVGSNNPTSSLDNGDLFFNTSTGKMLVYNGTNTAWEEVQSIGNFFISTLSPAFDGSRQDFTITNAPTNAEQILLVINGVVQKPNSGTSTPSEGFALDGSTVKLGAAPATGDTYHAVVIGSTVNIGTPSNNTVTTAILQDDSVTAPKIAAGAVGSTELAANAVITSKIADDAITTAKINGNAVGSTELADGAVTNGKLGSEVVTNIKVADNAINEQKLQVSNSPVNGYFLSAQSGNTGGMTWAQVNTDLVGDTSPQLGGDLDCNQKGILLQDRNSGNQGAVKWGDNGEMWMFHAGSDNTNRIYSSGKEYGIWSGASNDHIAFKVTASDTAPAVELYHDNSKKLSTVSNGVQFHGNGLVQDGYQLRLGDDNDAQVYHSGSHAYYANTTGNLNLTSAGAVVLKTNQTEDSIVCNANASTDLYHNGNKKLETTSGGATITGTCTATSFAGDGSNLTGISAFVSGMIILWSGAQNAIPSGWVLCNGSNGSPDLRDRFVVGAGNNYSVGNTGGADSVTLTVNQIPSHSHSAQKVAYSGNTSGWRPNGNGQGAMNTGNTGGGQAHENRPPYYALCYIMKT